MANLPIMKSGFLAMYPVTIASEFATDFVQFMDDSEQRWVGRDGLASFNLVYTDVNSYDLNTMREFFNSKKGRFVDDGLSNTFSITAAEIPGQPYNYCYFDHDDFTDNETHPNRSTFTLKIRQARKN